MKRPLPIAIVVVLVAASLTIGLTAVLAASDSQTGGPTRTVATADSPLGTILVDANGRTVYLFEKDSGPKSTCTGACAQEWHPVTTSGKPTAGDGLAASMVGTTTRSDGTTQVIYNGHPLYRYVGDNSPGDTAGQNLDVFGARWLVVSPAGDKVEGDTGNQADQPRYGAQSTPRPSASGY